MQWRTPDSTVALLREGYAFIAARCEKMDTDVFTTRIALRRVTCMRGAEAARLFYEGERFSRANAMPASVQHLLQDAGSVQTLEGAAHRQRKEMFLDLLGPSDLARLRSIFRRCWMEELAQSGQEMVLQDAAARILTRTACQWAGLELGSAALRRRTRELTAMINRAGSFGPANWNARRLRRNSERWAAAEIQAARSAEGGSGDVVQRLARHLDTAGRPLETQVAAVELLNLLRPVVAIGRYLVFSAVALEENPSWRRRIASGQDGTVEAFAQEVRRRYPFFPFVGGTVERAFTFADHQFTPGEWVLLDLYGTNHDRRLWPDPAAFDPGRFMGRQPGPNELVPQGAGNVAEGHRCPGEEATLGILAEAIGLLAAQDSWKVPVQDLSISLHKAPADPHSGFIMFREPPSTHAKGAPQ
ncbi:cytochrome P450 [Paeniglutamicibacter psychrophenolicus]|uniref:cytochrome P450 n=1 Tax=Paeniglutamicibacter psychrophenolicus TaxID=257454 RepID=UPI002787D87A|nr:cytochrome P450 [Paeniglutamicibacter psychrophenolicus]MDQ0096002.1 fatty-acid peroxygenase [Paeniglutamicibacter psychrophenolicus]